MKRVLSAIPPSPAGASALAKSEATWVMNVGISASRSGTAPEIPVVAPMYVTPAIATMGTNQAQSASATWRAISGTSPNCGIRK